MSPSIFFSLGKDEQELVMTSKFRLRDIPTQPQASGSKSPTVCQTKIRWGLLCKNKLCRHLVPIFKQKKHGRSVSRSIFFNENLMVKNTGAWEMPEHRVAQIRLHHVSLSLRCSRTWHSFASLCLYWKKRKNNQDVLGKKLIRKLNKFLRHNSNNNFLMPPMISYNKKYVYVFSLFFIFFFGQHYFNILMSNFSSIFKPD